MSKDDKEAKKEELLEKQKARQLTEEELEQVTGGWVAAFAIADGKFASVAEGKPGDNGFRSGR